MAKLVVLNTERAGTEIPLVPGKRFILGRNPDCDIVLNNVAGISRHHAVFEYHPDQQRWIVRDLNSQNGIFLNKERITEHRLQDGDALWFSTVRIRFHEDDTSSLRHAYFASSTEPSRKTDSEQTSQGAPKDVSEKTNVDEIKMNDLQEGEELQIRERTVSQIGLEQNSSPVPSSSTFVPPTSLRSPDLERPSVQQARPLEKSDHAPIDVEKIVYVGKIAQRIRSEFGKVIVGQKDVLDLLLTALLACGHVLMIGLPGLAKTLMVSTLARILQLKFKRIQFTPDLMPSDIIGSDVLEIDEETGKKSFRFIPGPIFTNLLLADEINRTPPKTQAALLEAMQERQVTASNQVFPLEAPFFVMATQNPLEQEGTYPLPEAQLDRFMFNIIVGYPSAEEEEEIVMRTTVRNLPQCEPVVSREELLEIQKIVRELPVSAYIVRYATRLVRATRPEDPSAYKPITQHISCGAGPRAAQFLVLGAKARAILNGQINVSCEDVRKIAPAVLRHRIYTNFVAESEGITPDKIIKTLLDSISEPESSGVPV